MKKWLKIVLRVIIFFILTVVTQIGGIVFLLSILIEKKWKRPLRFKLQIIFVSFYLISTFLIVPLIAPLFGRETVKHKNGIHPVNYMTVILNRNYVKPELNELLIKTAQNLEPSDIKISYLDANFPFINKFPLLPHLSHNDGEKIDLSLIYEDSKGNITNEQKSVSGYGVFEEPQKGEFNQINVCKEKGYFQYDYPKYLTFGKVNSDLTFSERGNKLLIKSLLKNDNLGKMFIEPHLKTRMGLINNRIRYQGCRAVRHDDHIHIQLK